MGKDNVIQVKAVEDGCVYLFDKNTGKCQKVCDVTTADDLPVSVREQIDAAWHIAAEILLKKRG